MNTAVAKPLNESGEQLRLFLRAFTADVPQGSPLVTELRALNSPQPYGSPRTEFGFFDLAASAGQKAFGQAVKSILDRPAERQPEGVYVTLNPLHPDLLARANNRLKVAKDRGATATDKNVLRRRWVLVDVDPVRLAGISSTDEERAIARHVLGEVREDLDRRGWPSPMVLDSGNGFHLWYPVDLPADDGGRVERTLKGLARMHDLDTATLDTSVFNASRIAKLPGTWARKGDSTAERPHRMARVLEAPNE